MKLSATQIKQAKPKARAYKLFDGGGLFLLVNSNGSKYWRYRYRFAGRDKTLALGTYPDVTLKSARKRLAEARQRLADELDPAAVKKATKRAQAGTDSFEAIAREWHLKNSRRWSASYADTVAERLQSNVYPWLGRRTPDEITAPDLLDVVQRIEKRGALETAHKVKQNCGQIFRYAIATQRATRDPAADLKGALPPVNTKHYASITDPKEIGGLLRAIDGYSGMMVTRCALQLAPLLFVRPGELRAAEWAEFDLDAAEWRIPAERMKMNAPHIVPLPVQAVAILREVEPLTRHGINARYVFPSARSGKRPMSENTLNASLRRMGYSKEQMTAHGFRSMASTLLNEQGWSPDAIERQLAHSERNSIRAAYNYAEYLPERQRMMQAWADYLDGLKRGADVVPIRSARV